MEFQTYVSWISSPVQIAFLDLVLGADNAVIIALVCRTLPRDQRVNVMIVGTGAAMLLRIVLTALTGALMFAPLLRLFGGLVLILIAVSLTDELDFGPMAEPATSEPAKPRDKQVESEAFWDAILLVVLADGLMSLDNTVALAAVAAGNLVYLILGLALSIPTLVFGSWLLTELLGATPFLAPVAMGVLAWVAGSMAVSDPFVEPWVTANAPALHYGVPMASVILVLFKSAFKPVAIPVQLVADRDVIASEPETSEQLAPDAKTDARSNAATTTRDPLDPVVTGSEAATALDAPDEGEIPRKRPPEERLVMIGLFALFAIAAAIMSAAIYLGGATF